MTDSPSVSRLGGVSPNNKGERSALAPWRRRVGKFFADVRVELSIGVLIIISVALTLEEFYLESVLGRAAEGDPRMIGLRFTNQGLTALFIIELVLRRLGMASWKRFFRDHWIDIFAVLPYFRVFRAARAMRLLRLLRLLRLFGLVSRLSTSYPSLLRRGAIEYLMVCGLLLMTVVFGTGALLFFEARPSGAEDEAFGIGEAFWFSVYSLFAGEPIPASPTTLGGRIVAVAIMFMGLTIFAIFTGTVSAFMVDRLRTEGNMSDFDELHDHVIICGWNPKAEIVLREFQASHVAGDTEVAVVAEFHGERPLLPGEMRRHVHFLEDDFTKVSALEMAGVQRAKTCILLADTRNNRSDQDADARTILAALTVEKLNPGVYTCAELYHRQYGSHLEMGHVNDYVVAGEQSAFMLAHAAMNRGLMAVLGELLTFQRGNQFYRMPVPPDWAGKDFLDAFVDLKRQHNAVLVAVRTATGEFLVNPTEYQFAAGDDVVVIAEEEVALT